MNLSYSGRISPLEDTGHMTHIQDRQRAHDLSLHWSEMSHGMCRPWFALSVRSRTLNGDLTGPGTRSRNYLAGVMPFDVLTQAAAG